MMWNKLRQAVFMFRKPFRNTFHEYTDGAVEKVTHAKPMFKKALILSSGLCVALLLTDVTGKFLSTPKIKLTVSDRLVDAINRKIDLRNFDSCEGRLAGHLKYCRGDDPEHDIEEEFDVEISFKISKMDKDDISDESK